MKVILHFTVEALKLCAMRRFVFFILLLPITLILISRLSLSQPPEQVSPVDSLITTQMAGQDSLFQPADTSESESADVDTTIDYSAHSIEFFVDKKQTLLKGNAQVVYQGMQLRAGKITVDWENNLITAESYTDTLWEDSLQTVLDTVIIVGQPVFSEGGQQIVGEKMIYNLKSRRGRVIEGRTEYQDGYYWGGALQKEPSEVLYAGPGSFTTCASDTPHYSFHAQQMKLMVGNKVVAKPVIIHFGEVPVMAVPYGVFPARSGRHSGLIVPTYGESSGQGRFIRHLGYYWATNDYMDLTGSLDYYERSGFLFHSRARYEWRYHLSGSLEGAYIRQHLGSTKKRRWELRLGHNQEINPDTRLNVDANIISDGSYYQDYSFNLNEQLTQTLRSDATISHNFPEGKNSISANLHHEQNLLNDEVSQNIPRITFRRGQSAIIPLPEKSANDTTEVEPRWFHNLYYSYSGEYLHRRVLNQISSTNTGLEQDRRSAVKHNLRFNSPQKILSYFSISPGINYDEHWFGEYRDYSESPSGKLVSRFKARRTYSFSLGLSSKLYGYWMNPLPGVEAFRHTATPNLSLVYRPDFSDPKWGYYQEVTDSAGVATSYDRFYGSLFGSTPKGKQLSLNYQLSNLFQMKYGSGEKKNKCDLFNLNFSGSYDFAKDSLKFSDLSSSFRATPISKSQPIGPLESLSLDLSTTHSFYKYGSSGVYDEYYFDPQQGKILRLTGFNASTTTNFSIGTLIHSREEVRYEEDQTESGMDYPLTEIPPDTTALESLKKPQTPAIWYMGQVPWGLQLSFRYSSSRSNPNNPVETFWMNASIDASITPKWQISYNTRVDLVEHKVVSAGLTIYRDMHCWEGRLVWNPLGIGQGYYLKINIKSTQLQDIKVEKRRGQGTFMGF